jgi:hypothetical protein
MENRRSGKGTRRSTVEIEIVISFLAVYDQVLSLDLLYFLF